VATALVHTYRVPTAGWSVTTATPIAAGWSVVTPVITGEIVSETMTFVIVTPPVFATITRYVTPSPTCGFAGTCCFVTVYAKVGATSRKSVPFVYIRVPVHAVAAVTHAVFDTVVWVQTMPTVPAIVNVYTTPGFIVNPARLHAYCVPLAVCVTTGAPQPAGRSVVAPVIVGDIVSVTVRSVTVAVPLLVTTILYVIADAATGTGGVWILSTEMFVTGGWTTFPTMLVNIFELVHADVPMTNAVFDIGSVAHTSPTRPAIVKVYTTPGFIVNPALVHRYCVPEPAIDVTAGTAHPAGWSEVAPMMAASTVSTIVSAVRVAVPLLVTTTRYVIASPTPGLAGDCCLSTVRFVVGGLTTCPIATDWTEGILQMVPAATSAVFDTCVAAHTSPTPPEIVNV
jgi:hypothetical protein